jgi:hypothetical protein
MLQMSTWQLLFGGIFFIWFIQILLFTIFSISDEREGTSTTESDLFFGIYYRAFFLIDSPCEHLLRGDEVTTNQDKKLLRLKFAWVLHQVSSHVCLYEQICFSSAKSVSCSREN